MFTVGTVASCIAWVWHIGSTAVDEAPDILAEEGVGRYFEADGLCLAPRLEAVEGLCWLCIYCQNRYDRPCTGTVYLLPMEGATPDGSHGVLPIEADIELDGGEVGVVKFPYPIAQQWQGKIMVYDILATVTHPAGHGMLVRTPRGLPVSEPSSEMRNAIATMGLLAFGIVRVSKASSLELRLPNHVSEILPEGAGERVETLWKYEKRTGGFPILPHSQEEK